MKIRLLLKTSCYTLLFLVTACGKKPTTPPPIVPKVKVAPVTVMTIPIVIEGIGHVTAYNSADIKAQVEGVLMEVSYQEGQLVEQGSTLVTIDPSIYQAQLMDAEGALVEARAKKSFAQNKEDRYSKLVKDQFVSQLNYFEYVTNNEEADGQVLQSEAMVQKNKVTLDYCYIKAPFTGRCSKKLVDVGNLILNGQQTLVTINQISPIYIDFSVPEFELPRIMKYYKQGPLNVNVQVNGSDESWVTNLVVVDNAIKEKTGTIPLRAQYANTEEALWPGQFARCQLVLTQKPNTLMVPAEAISMGRFGPYVVTVDKNHIAKIHWVKTGEQLKDLIEILSEEIKPTDQVVTDGQIMVFDGAKVQIL